MGSWFSFDQNENLNPSISGIAMGMIKRQYTGQIFRFRCVSAGRERVIAKLSQQVGNNTNK
jgi:hypothetical protein